MGYPRNAALKALKLTGFKSVEEALEIIDDVTTNLDISPQKEDEVI